MVFGRMIRPISSLSQLNASNQIIWQVLSAGKDAKVPLTKAPGMLSLQHDRMNSFFNFPVWID